MEYCVDGDSSPRFPVPREPPFGARRTPGGNAKITPEHPG